MIGDNPLLAIDASLGTEPDSTSVGGKQTEYIEGLKKPLHFAYKVASMEARRQAIRQKKRYNRWSYILG